MRIISWNMNQRERLGRCKDAWSFLLKTIDPDIALLQEAVLPGDLDGYDVRFARAWPESAWGSAILLRGGTLMPVWEDASRGAVLVARSSDSALGSVSVAVIHARVIHRRVIPSLRATFDSVRPQLGPRFVVGGDFNTARAAAAAWPANGHGEFWQDLETWGFKEPLPEGGERQSFWREWLRNKLPTIGNSLQDDHVLVDSTTFDLVTNCRVWDTRIVRELSDHGPVVVDIAAETTK